jgi:uncharacterized protein (DUF983 family)
VIDEQQPADPAAALVGADGRSPARAKKSKDCPRCDAAPEKRRLSGGFGAVHDVCGSCGYDFPERTIAS